MTNIVIGLTGRIASGKDEVARILGNQGFEIIDVDAVGHQVLAEPQIKAALRKSFGETVFDGQDVSRKYLAHVVFSSREQLHLLEQIVHPRMTDIVTLLVHRADHPVVINAAVLWEMGLDRLCDEVWVVDTDDELIRERLRSKGYSEEEITRRVTSQKTREQYTAKADKVICNNSSRADLEKLVKELTSSALHRYRRIP